MIAVSAEPRARRTECKLRGLRAAMSADLLLITVDVVLPIFLMATVGLISRRALKLDPRALAPVGIYVLMPALLFNSLTTTKMQGDEVIRIGLFTVCLLIILVVGTSVLSRFLHIE